MPASTCQGEGLRADLPVPPRDPRVVIPGVGDSYCCRHKLQISMAQNKANSFNLAWEARALRSCRGLLPSSSLCPTSSSSSRPSASWLVASPATFKGRCVASPVSDASGYFQPPCPSHQGPWDGTGHSWKIKNVLRIARYCLNIFTVLSAIQGNSHRCRRLARRHLWGHFSAHLT